MNRLIYFCIFTIFLSGLLIFFFFFQGGKKLPQETSAKLVSYDLISSEDLNLEDESYISQELSIKSCGTIKCESKYVNSNDNSMGFNYFSMEKPNGSFDVNFKVHFKSLIAQDLYIIGLLNESVVPFDNHNFLRIKNDRIQTGELNLSVKLTTENKIDYANISFIALSEEEIKQSGGLINFTTVSIMTKQKEDKVISDSTLEYQNDFKLKSPDQLIEASNEEKYLISNEQQQQTYKIKEAENIEITGGKMDEFVSLSFLDKDLNIHNTDPYTTQIEKNTTSIFKLDAAKKDSNLKYIVINEEPHHFHSKAKYDFIKGTRPIPPAIQLMIW